MHRERFVDLSDVYLPIIIEQVPGNEIRSLDYKIIKLIPTGLPSTKPQAQLSHVITYDLPIFKFINEFITDPNKVPVEH